MWGGITNSTELRAIADAADKYNVQTVKVTGGQRIDLLGVKSEDLPSMWADLGEAGLVSGHAYAKGLRTVKTCVGTDHCRFGAAGMDLREIQRLTKVETEDEAMEAIIAFVQLYRENAKYLDRPYKWIAKVGLDWVIERIEDDTERARLVAAFELSQSIYQKDPWAERAKDEEAAKFRPLADLTLEAAE